MPCTRAAGWSIVSLEGRCVSSQSMPEPSGHLFLPFADDDPETAEMVSRVLLLSRDSEIKDPLILQQIYARA